MKNVASELIKWWRMVSSYSLSLVLSLNVIRQHQSHAGTWNRAIDVDEEERKKNADLYFLSSLFFVSCFRSYFSLRLKCNYLPLCYDKIVTEGRSLFFFWEMKRFLTLQFLKLLTSKEFEQMFLLAFFFEETMSSNLICFSEIDFYSARLGGF